MKLKQKIFVSLLLVFSSALCFTGCSALTNPKKDVVVIGGTFNIAGAVPDALLQNNKSRSATSNFQISGIEYEVSATDEYSNEKLGSVSGSNYIIELDRTGNWTIDVKGKVNISGQDEYILSGQKTISNNRLFNNTKNENITLYPVNVSGVNGSINLDVAVDPYRKRNLDGTISDDIDYINSVVCTWSALGGGTLDSSLAEENPKTFLVSEYHITLDYPSVTPGSYNLQLSFIDQKGKEVYNCQTVVTVFSYFETNTWVGNDEFLQELGVDQKRFMVTEKNIISYPKLLIQYPIVLWDADYAYKSKEFSPPQPGYAVFDELQPDDWKSDGSSPAKRNREEKTFAIDPITQNVYTIEYDSSDYYFKLVCTSYLGDEVQSRDICNLDELISGFRFLNPTRCTMCASNENVYIFEKGDSYDRLYKIDTSGATPQLTNYGSPAEKITTLSSYENFKIDAYDDSFYILGYKITEISDEKVLDMAVCKVRLNADSTITTLKNGGGFRRKFTDHFGFTTEQMANFDFSRNNVVYVGDIQIVPQKGSSWEKLCVLVSVKVVNRNDKINIIRGGILTFTLEDNDTLALGNTFVGYSSSDNIPAQTYPDMYFYGPERFVARKPDELVIADEGSWVDVDLNQAYNKNRVVTVNLSDFSIKDYKDVNFGFNTYCSTEASNGFYYCDYYSTYGSTY